MTLARQSEGTTITLLGARLFIRETAEDVGNSAVQQRFRVKIGATELTASAWASKTPVRGDMLTVAGRVRAIQDVRPLNMGDTVAGYDLEVAG